MSVTVTMPALGESVTEGTVTRWLKKVGDTVAADEPLLEVSTDKVDTEIPSPVAGVVEKILVGEDETVDVGTELAIIGSGEGIATEPEPEPAAAPAPEPSAPAPAPATPVAAAPCASPAVGDAKPVADLSGLPLADSRRTENRLKAATLAVIAGFCAAALAALLLFDGAAAGSISDAYTLKVLRFTLWQAPQGT